LGGISYCLYWYITLPIIEPVAEFEDNHHTDASWGGKVKAYRIAMLGLLAVSWTTLAGAKDIALISNKTNHVDGVSLPELVKICKGQTNHWQDGKPVTLVIRDPASAEMKLVLQKIYEMPKEDVIGLIASANHNRQNHPAILVVDSDEALVKKVESEPGAVGLVDVYAITGAVTVMRVDRKLPLEPGYALHGN
jgi:ABC-type phosphate transport system substrate-binding protein